MQNFKHEVNVNIIHQMQQTCQNRHLQLDEDFIVLANEVTLKLGLPNPDELDNFQDAVDYFISLASAMNIV